MDAIRQHGWDGELVFSNLARDKPWLSDLYADDIPVRFLPCARRPAQRELSDFLREANDTVLLHTHFSRFDLPSVIVAGRRSRTLVFWHEHTALSERSSIRLRNVLRFVVFGRGVERFLCVSPDIARQLGKRGAPRSRLVFLPNGIDGDRFPLIDPHERRAARAALGLDDSVKVLLHCGWDWHRKGGDLLLGAVRHLVEEGRERVVAITIGGGEQAESLAARLGISESVLAVAATERVNDLYAAADVFVSPSRAEGMPFAVAEALSRGLGVVATDLSGQRPLGAGLSSRLLVAMDPGEIAAAVRSLLVRDADTIAADARAAHEWILTNMGLETWSNRLTAIYEEALEARLPG
jgi:glycosyltransferase involved in cell wall biosynthesis